MTHLEPPRSQSQPDQILSLARALGFDLSRAQTGQLAAYAERLRTSAHNLISAHDRDHVAARHLGEALALGRLLDDRGLLQPGVRVLDLGTGGGLPGVPIRIAWPSLTLTLLESVAKKCRFLVELSAELELGDLPVLEGRAETWGRDPAQREEYDLVLARAVAPLPVLIEYGLPFLRRGGRLVAVKGSAATEEVAAAQAALRELNGRLESVLELPPSGGGPLAAVLVEKAGPTPQRYPRRPGIPTKRPL